MTKNSTQNKTRQKLVDEYLKSLKEEMIPWHRSWVSVRQHNVVSKKNYRGVNQLLLSLMCVLNDYKDSRWMTFNQANSKGWKIRKGEKGVPVEFWSPYDLKTRKTVTVSQMNSIIEEDPKRRFDFKPISRCIAVFNGEQVEGIPEYKEISFEEKNPHPFVENLIMNMGVAYNEEGNKAFYSPLHDSVHIPPNRFFENDYAYETVRLHELAHATGHKSRLNRDQSGMYGSEKYAVEELRAEIASSFIAAELNLPSNEDCLYNHKAYIQHYISILENDPNELFRAIKDAEKICDYVIDVGELEKFRIIENDIVHDTNEDEILVSKDEYEDELEI